MEEHVFTGNPEFNFQLPDADPDFSNIRPFLIRPFLTDELLKSFYFSDKHVCL